METFRRNFSPNIRAAALQGDCSHCRRAQVAARRHRVLCCNHCCQGARQCARRLLLPYSSVAGCYFYLSAWVSNPLAWW